MAPAITVKRQGPDVTAQSAGVGLYREATARGITVSQLLERMDPTAERAEKDRGLDAFERVLKEMDISIFPDNGRGLPATTWEEATDTPEKRAMMPELCSRIWRGVSAPTVNPVTPNTRSLLLSGDNPLNTLANQYTDDLTPRARRIVPPIPLNRIVAETVPIRGDAYRSLYINDDLGTDAYRMKRITEGSDIPTTTMVSGEHVIRIGKYGRGIRSTYEQIRRLPLDRILFLFQRMAVQAEADKVAAGLDVIINGDGNANTAATVLNLTTLDPSASAGALTLKGWIAAKLAFTAAYSPDTVLGQTTAITQLMLLPINTVNGNPLVTQNATPFGAIRPINDRLADGTEYGVTNDAPALKLVMFDSTVTLVRVTEIGGNVSEVENFINNQTTLITLTESEGFALADTWAGRVLNINA